MLVRDPLPNEEVAYRAVISARDEVGYRRLFQIYPNVLWGSITRNLSEEDNKWAKEVCEKMNQERFANEDEW